MKNAFRLYANGFTPKSEKRTRKQFRFDLDLNKVNELEIANWFLSLKKNRQFKRMLMEAIALFCDLLNGNITLLTEQFPGIVAEIEANVQNESIDALRKDVAALQEQLMMHNIPIPKLSGRERVEFDEPVVELKAEKGTANVLANFLGSMNNGQ